MMARIITTAIANVSHTLQEKQPFHDVLAAVIYVGESQQSLSEHPLRDLTQPWDQRQWLRYI